MRLLPATFVALIAALTAVGAWVVGSAPVGAGRDPARLEISVPATITAGDELTVDIDAEPGSAVTVHFFDGYGASTRHVTLQQASGRLAGPSPRFAGQLDIVAIAGSRQAATTISVLPRERLDPPVPLIGARSIVADGADRSMVAVIPSDRYGNPAPAGTPVQVTVQHPDGSLATFPANVDRTVAWTWIPSSTTSGTATVTASTQGRPGPARTLVEIPGNPEPFALESETELRPADGASLVTVASEPLIDRHGNRLVDGIAVVVRARYPSGFESRQTVTVTGGIARALLSAPDEPGVVRVWMTVHGTTSAPLDLAFSPPLATGGGQ